MALAPRIRTPERAAVDSLIRLAEAGSFALPAPVATAVRNDAQARQRYAVNATIERGRADKLITELAEQIADGKTPKDMAASVAEIEQAERLTAIEGRVCDRAADMAEEKLFTAIRKHGDAVHGHLAEAFEQVLDRTAPVAAILREVNVEDDRALLYAKPEVQQAVKDLRELAERHSAIREGERQLRKLTGEPKYDEIGACWLWPDPRPIYGDAWRARMLANQQPWDGSPAAFLLWAVTGAPVPMWLPSAWQQDGAGHALIESERSAGRRGSAATV